MELVTSELREMLPPLYSQEHEEDPLVICNFSLPIATGRFMPLNSMAKTCFSAGSLGLKKSSATSAFRSLDKLVGRMVFPLRGISISCLRDYPR